MTASRAQARRADRRTARPVRARRARHRVRYPARRRRRPRRAAARAHGRRRGPDPLRDHGSTPRHSPPRPQLKVVARAGIGLDNVDVPAATARGVLVVNAPQSNIVTAAEHARRACCSPSPGRSRPPTPRCARGEWKRSRFTGVEIADKTVGVVGLGRIGQLFASRIAAFGTTVIAYDPYLQPAGRPPSASGWSTCRPCSPTADIISIHLPRTPETLGLIGAAELATVKPGVIIVNAARGGLIDEQALADALDRRPGRAAPASTCTSRSRWPPTARCGPRRTRCSPRTWARPPPRRRTRPAPRSPARSSWRCAATSCRTRSTCRPPARCRTSCGRGSRWSPGSAPSSPRSPAACPARWSSRCAATSPPRTPRSCSWPRCAASSAA